MIIAAAMRKNALEDERNAFKKELDSKGLKLLEIWCVLVDRGCFWSSCWGDISRCRLSGGC
jgi:hypothetical protein